MDQYNDLLDILLYFRKQMNELDKDIILLKNIMNKLQEEQEEQLNK